MQLDRLERKLERLERESIKGKRVRDLHRIFNLPEIWYEAYANIYSNKGAMTTGIDDDTLDGMSKERIEKIIRSLREGTYFLYLWIHYRTLFSS
jgi:RNA-directed DNA polymerase